MDINIYTKKLTKKDGIWYADKKNAISYPDDGNDNCLAVEENSFWFRHRNDCLTEVLRKFPPKGTFFDIGGGNGYQAKAIEDIGIETVLVEPGEKGCLNAQKKLLTNIVCSTLEDAGFEKNSIPAIGVFDVVEHFEHDKALLSSLNSFLIKNGLIYITVPSYNFLWSNEDDDTGHHNRYTLKSLSKKLNETGYKVVYTTYFFSILPLPILLFRTIPSKLGLNKNSNGKEKHVNEHSDNVSLLDNVWRWELNKIRQGKKIKFGGSCLVVAEKL